MLSYNSKSKFLTKQRNEIINTWESSIKSIKQSSINSIKKNLIQSMLATKLSSVSNFKVKVQENQPKVKSKLAQKPSKIQWNSSRFNKPDLNENSKSRNFKANNKEFYSRNFSQQINRNIKDKVHTKNKVFSPILSAKENESDDNWEQDDKETWKISDPPSTSKIATDKSNYKLNLENSEIQHIVKMNLELIQTLHEVIESSQNFVNVLTNAGNRNTFSVKNHERLIRNLKQKFQD